MSLSPAKPAMRQKDTRMHRLARRIAAATLTLAAAATVAGAASAFELKDEPKVAFIYGATARDGGWNEALDNAKQKVEADLGMKIATVESIPEEATALKNAIDLFAGRGFNVIVGTTYGYSDGILEAANKYPDIAFINASGATNSANLEGFYARTYQGWYLAGMAAAGVSETGKVGILGGFPVGPVNWDMNAFTLGARAIDPEIEVIVVYTNSWWDPVKEGEVTKAMLDQGADVIANNLSSSSPFVAAEEAGAKSIGFQLDMSKHAPEGMLTSVVFNWEKYLEPTLQAMKDGTWTPNEYGAFPGMDEGVVAIAPLSDAVPADIKAKIEDVAAKMEAGEFSPFDGPITAQDGTVKVAEGETLDDGGLWSMDFLVEGTTGTLN
ncbi:BMP family ABC transporter substrate-binding protein [Acuticoccus sp. MNP-M23]|uniref:BMP family ABC transporter substrate-binding protein n=1 Tax=Acuticoccus sp. MNP-M23 TaxID=3072793 RepID=UPI002814C9CF|nr:BMP family ABC transporter substrate-binding protein [Acuticoccus sp. MNP-M23]WMS44721.1 BMP family ABC transporter substrate-binding protein [Acuticoccus sp. MNP-M23]